jgi:curved DNA-binding protein CbpA
MPRNFKRRIPTHDQFYSSSSEVTNALIKSHYVNGIERTFIENLRVLGLTTSQASTDEIKKRYRLLSKQLHTDKVSGASPSEYSFAQVDDAYKALLAALRKRTSADVVIEIDELERSINEKQSLLQEDIQNKAALMQANAAYHQHNYSYQKLKADYYDAIDSVITDKNIVQVNAFKRIYPSIVKDDLLSGLKGNFLESNDRINYRPLELYKDILLELSADIFLMKTLPDASDQHFNQLRPNATFIFVKTPVPALFFLKQTESKLSEFVSVPVDKKKLAEVILPARKIDSNNILQSF